MMDFRQNTFLTKIDNKKCLVFSAGDSWTFGDSLGNIATVNDKDDYQARFTQCYGRLVADYYDADWINFGGCGWSNYAIVEVLYDMLLPSREDLILKQEYDNIKGTSWPDEFFEDLTVYDADVIDQIRQSQKTTNFFKYNIKNYEEVIVLVTLTETGRASDRRKLNNFESATSLQCLEEEERIIYEKLNLLKKKTGYKFVIGRNFTVDFESTTNSVCDLPLNWVNLNFNHNAKSGFDNLGYTNKHVTQSGPVSEIGFLFNKYNKNVITDYKQFFVDQIERTNDLRKWLRNNPLHNNIATCHPKAESHKLWSDYIISFLCR